MQKYRMKLTWMRKSHRVLDARVQVKKHVRQIFLDDESVLKWCARGRHRWEGEGA